MEPQLRSTAVFLDLRAGRSEMTLVAVIKSTMKEDFLLSLLKHRQRVSGLRRYLLKGSVRICQGLGNCLDSAQG